MAMRPAYSLRRDSSAIIGVAEYSRSNRVKIRQLVQE